MPLEAPHPLEAIGGIARLMFRPGQVIVHADHVPMALLLVLDGEVELVAGARRQRVRADAQLGPFLIPLPDRIDDPLTVAVIATRATTALCIPRSLVLLDPALPALVAPYATRVLPL